MILREDPAPARRSTRRCRCRSSGRSSAACRRIPRIATRRRATSRAICRRCAITAAIWHGLDAPRLARGCGAASVSLARRWPSPSRSPWRNCGLPRDPAGPAVHRKRRAPTFQQLTFRRGLSRTRASRPTARRSSMPPAGTAARSGCSKRASRTRITSAGPAIGGSGQHLVDGRLALILGCRLDWANCVGTLARMPPGGGAPREILEDVVSADWTPDGQALAAIQVTGGRISDSSSRSGSRSTTRRASSVREILAARRPARVH